MAVDAKTKLVQIVRSAKGDDLERAEMSFGRMSHDERQQEYGQSGQTCQQILDGYRKERAEWRAAMDLVETL